MSRPSVFRYQVTLILGDGGDTRHCWTVWAASEEAALLRAQELCKQGGTIEIPPTAKWEVSVDFL